MADWPWDADTLATEARRLVPHQDEVALSPVEAQDLGRALAAGIEGWWPSPARLFRVKKRSGGERVLGKQVRVDRVVQRALLLTLDRLPPPPAGVTSYVRGRGAWMTIGWLEGMLAGREAGGTGRAIDRPSRSIKAWSLDVVDFYPSIDLAALRTQVMKALPSGLTRELVLRSLAQPVEAHGVWVPERGILQGAVLSGWLSNLALVDLDRRFGGSDVHRYCDNLYVAGPEGSVRQKVAGLVAGLADLKLRVRLTPPEPSPAEVGIDCLGHRISARGRAPGKSRMMDFFGRLRSRLAAGAEASAADLSQGHRAFYGERTWRGVMEIDELLRAGRFAEARAKLQAEQEKLAIIDEALELSATETALLLAAVGGDPHRHVEERDRGRVVVPRRLAPEDLARHRVGAVRLGVLPVDRSGFAHVGVVDLDGVGGATDDHALRVAAAVRAGGRPALVEETGGRGHHVWVPLEQPMPRARLTQALEAATQDAGPLPFGVKQEIFPAPPDQDPAVRLPLGRHPATGRPSRLLNLAGQPRVDGRDLTALLTPSAKVPLLRSEAPRRILEGCPLLADLAREACTTHDLDHTGRYSLASVLAGVPGGTEAIHDVISHCTDYDHEITQHHIDRLHERPLGCKRLKERHPVLAGRCVCPRARAGLEYPSPTIWGLGERGRVERGRQPEELERLLAGVVRSLARLKRP